jgi:hypothetical protein
LGTPGSFAHHPPFRGRFPSQRLALQFSREQLWEWARQLIDSALGMFKIFQSRAGRDFDLAPRVAVETFERRVLLSANPTIALDPTTLKANGSVDEGAVFALNLVPEDSEQDPADGQWDIYLGNGNVVNLSGDNSTALLSYPQGPHN